MEGWLDSDHDAYPYGDMLILKITEYDGKGPS